MGLMKDELNKDRVCCIETKNFLTDYIDENKKSQGTKRCAIKRKLKFEDYKNCLEATQLKNETNQLEKNKLDVGSLRENQNELTKKQ